MAGERDGEINDRSAAADLREADDGEPGEGEPERPLSLVGPPRPVGRPVGTRVAAPPVARVARRLLLAGLLIAGALAAVAWLPWEWSFIDDSALLDRVDLHVRAHGAVGGFIAAACDMYGFDRAWGLFRPAYWVYVAGFYQLPVGAAHAVRVAMLLAVFAGALAAVVDQASGQRRAVLAAWTLLAVAANDALFMGVWYPSLQELGALCFVGLGLVARRRPWLLFLCWLVAAWFKSPFAWLLLAHGLLLCRRRADRAVGVLMTAFAVATLGFAAVLARGGYYTNGVADFSPQGLRAHAETALGVLGPPALVLLAGALVLRPRSNLGRDPLAWSLLVGGAGYLANLLPWRTDTHYAAPYLYLLTVGALVALRDLDRLTLRRALAGLVMPLLLAGGAAGSALLNGWFTHANVTGLRDCVRGLPPGSVVGFNRTEGWIRLEGIVRRRDPGWTGRVVLVRDGQTAGEVWTQRVDRVDYYIHQPGYGAGSPALMTGPLVCRTHQAKVYRVR